MPDVFSLEGNVSLIVFLLLLAFKAFVFINACLWPAEAYSAASKLTKNTWLAILGIAFVLQLPILGGPFFSLLSLAGTVAAIVYLVDVRPAVAGLYRSR